MTTETVAQKQDVEAKVEIDNHEQHALPAGFDDPHKAALEDNPDRPEKLTISVLLSALFLGTSFSGPIVFGFLFVNPTLVQLSQKLGGETISYWNPSGWGLSAAVGFSIAGRLSDIFGRRYVLIFGQLLTIIGGIVAGTANSMNQLIAGEVILGASIGTVSVAYAGVSEILPNKYRGMGLAWTEFNLSIWAIPSTLLANLMVTNASWRIMFWITIAYGAFSMGGTLLVYFPPSHPRADGKTKWQQFKDLDFVGALLFVAGLTIFLFGLNSGGNLYPWTSAGALAPLILGFFIFLGAFIYDFNVAKDPLFPWYLFRAFRDYSSLIVLVFVAGMVFFAASSLNAQTILYLHTADPIKIGIYSIPNGVGQFVGGVVITSLVHYIKHVNYQLTFAVFMQTLFFGLCALITPTNLGWLMAGQTLAMLPFGWITINCYTAASVNVPQRDLGVAIGLIGTFRSVGGSVGSTLFSSIFKQTAAKQIARRVAETVANAKATASIPELVAAVDKTLVGVPGLAAKFPKLPAAVYNDCVTAARYGYAYGFRITWLASIPFGIIAVCCAMCVRDPSKYFTNHVEIHLEKELGGARKLTNNNHDEPEANTTDSS